MKVKLFFGLLLFSGLLWSCSGSGSKEEGSGPDATEDTIEQSDTLRSDHEQEELLQGGEDQIFFSDGMRDQDTDKETDLQSSGDAKETQDSGEGTSSGYCGDGICDENRGENCENCADDCGCKEGERCFDMKCCRPKTCEELVWECGTIDDGCGKMLNCGNCPQGETCMGGTCEKGIRCKDAWGCLQTCGFSNDCFDQCGSDILSVDKPVYDNLKNCLKTRCPDYKQECIDNAIHNECADNYNLCMGPSINTCGDGICSGDENCETCSEDCGCKDGQVCFNEACCTPKTCEDLNAECGTYDNGCGGEINCGTCSGDKACSEGKCVDAITCAQAVQCIMNCGDNDTCIDGCFNRTKKDHKPLLESLGNCVEQQCPESSSSDECVQNAIQGACKEQFDACINAS